MGTATQLILGLDVNGNPTYRIGFSNTGVATTLSAGVEQHTTVPAGCDTAFFSYSTGTDVWVSNAQTAAVPTGSFAAKLADLNPVARLVKPGEVLSFISASVASVKVSYYLSNTTGTSAP